MSHDTSHEPRAQNVVIESQLDWLTVGCDEGQRADRLEAWAFAKGQAEKRAGFRELPFRLVGFEGWAIGRVRFGRRADSALCQLSGSVAEEQAATLVPRVDRVSRVDLAVTVRLGSADPFLGESTYAQAVNWREEHPQAALPKLVQDGDGGCTCYVGRRSSDSLLRVYNKAAEAKAEGDAATVERYERCWRYELECKGTLAKAMAVAAAGAVDRPSFVQRVVYSHAERHGIEAAFPLDGDRVLIPGFRRRSDYLSRLGWLRRSVNPAILSMMEEGDRDEILEALGLASIPSASGS